MDGDDPEGKAPHHVPARLTHSTRIGQVQWTIWGREGKAGEALAPGQLPRGRARPGVPGESRAQKGHVRLPASEDGEPADHEGQGGLPGLVLGLFWLA